MKTIKLNILRVKQSIGDIFVSKINPKDLLIMSVVDRRRIEEDDLALGIQRELRRDKVIQIQSYLTSIDATFPNSIILNTNSQYIVSQTDSELELEISDNTFSIIDGQHRLEGFRDSQLKEFELIITIFCNLRLDQQANIFSTINSQQTSVDPSLSLNLELQSEVYTPKKMMIEIAQSFNYDVKSPWFNSIKMLGSGSEGIISLSAFVSPLLDLTYSDRDYYKIRNILMENEGEKPDLSIFTYKPERYLFWELYTRKDFNSIYKILFNYFSSLSKILEQDWKNKSSLLNKTTGYNAIIKLFKDVANIGFEKKDLSFDFFFNELKPLSYFNGTLNSENYGASGFKASNDLYVDMKKALKSSDLK